VKPFTIVAIVILITASPPATSAMIMIQAPKASIRRRKPPIITGYQPNPNLPNTYTDPIVGFQFDYPEGWTISGVDDPAAIAYAITMASYDFLSAVGGGMGIPEGESKYDIYVMPEGEFNTLDALRARYAQPGDNGDTAEILEEAPRTLSDGRRPIADQRHV
jgi:hypothetical protein